MMKEKWKAVRKSKKSDRKAFQKQFDVLTTQLQQSIFLASYSSKNTSAMPHPFALFQSCGNPLSKNVVPTDDEVSDSSVDVPFTIKNKAMKKSN